MKHLLLKTWLMLVLLLVGVGTSWGAIETGTYTLCTSTSDLQAGAHYIIASGKSGTVNCISNVSNTNNRKVVSAIVTDSQIEVDNKSTIMTLTLGGSTGAWTLYTNNYDAAADGYLASAASGSNNYCRVIGEVTTGTISFSNDAAIINLKPHTERTKLQYNSSNSLFACYSNNQGAIYLFKKSTADDTRTEVNMTGFAATTTTLIKGNTTTTSVTNDQNGWTPSYTYESSNTSVATVANDGVITAVAKGTATITARLNIAIDDATWKKGATASKAISITVNNPSHTAQFSINGTIDPANNSTVEENETITFPSDPSEDGVAFMGWATAAIDGTQDDAPTMYMSATMGTADVTYYAVFATADGEETTESFGWEEETTPSNWKLGGTFTRTEANASYSANSGNYYGLTSSNSSVQYTNKVKVKSFSYYCVRRTTNTNTSIKIETSTNGTSWTEALSTTWNTFNSDGKTYKKIEKTWAEPVECYVRVNIQTAANRQLDDISITYGDLNYSDYCTTVSTKPTPTLSFANPTYNATMGEDFTAPTLTNEEGVTVSYASSNTGVATVNATTGAVELVAVGTTTITASFAGDATYKAASASYDLVVAPAQFSYTIETIGSGTTIFKDGSSNIVNPGDKVTTGTVIYPTFTPDDGYEFTSWEYWGVSDDVEQWKPLNVNNFTITKNVRFRVTYTAIAPKAKYVVTIVTPENGNLTIKDGETVINNGDEVEEGTILTIECTPANEDYRFKNWQYQEEGGSLNTRYTNPQDYTMPSANVQFKANFELIPTYTINWSVNGVVVKTDENVKQGAALTAPEVSTINGKNFTGWVTTSTVAADATPSYVYPSTATTDETYYAVFADGDGNGSEDATSISSYADGDYYIVDFYDNKYYAFTGAVDSKKLTATDITSAVTLNGNGSITLDPANVSLSSSMVYTISKSEDNYIIKNKVADSEIYLQPKGNDLGTTLDETTPINWTGFEEGTDDKASRFSLTASGTNSKGSSTNNCLLLQTTNGSAQAPTFVVKGYVQSNRGSVTAKAQCYASGYMWFVPADGGASYSNFTTNPLTQTFDLTVGEAGYATLCLAYNATVPSGVQIFTGKYENDGVTLTQPIDDDKVCARVGYIIKANPDTYTFTQTIDEVTAPTENDLVGVLENKDMTEHANDGHTFIFTKKNETVGFYVCTGGTLGANKAYLYTPETQSRTFIGFGDDETSINIVEKENITDGKFIEGNKVIIVKNGVKYNVNGQRLR